MSKDNVLKSMGAAFGAVLAVALMVSPVARAAENPFHSADNGIVVADNEGNDKDAGKSEAMKKCDAMKDEAAKKKCEDDAKAKEGKK